MLITLMPRFLAMIKNLELFVKERIITKVSQVFILTTDVTD